MAAGGVAAGERLAEIADRAAIRFDDVGMQDDRGSRALLGELGLGDGALIAAIVDTGAHDVQIRAGGERVDQAGYFAIEFGDTAFELAAPRAHRAIGDRPLFVKAFDDGADDFRGEQLVFEPAEHAALERCGRNAPAVGAAAGLPVADTAPTIAGDDGIGAAAIATADEPRQQVARPAGHPERLPREGIAARLDGVPKVLIDDAQIGRVNEDAIGVGVDAAEASPAFGILDHMDPVPRDPADIGGVAEDAVHAAARAVDRRRAPFGAARGRDTLAVELLGDRLGALAVAILGEDVADDVGLIGHDTAMAALDRAIGQQQGRGLIAVAKPAGDPAARDDAALAPPDLIAEFLDEQRVHGAEHADVKLGDRPFGDGDHADAGEFDTFEDGGDIGLIAGDAIERLGNDEIEAARVGGGEQGVQAGAMMGGARDRQIGIDLDDIDAVAISPFATDADLILG